MAVRYLARVVVPALVPVLTAALLGLAAGPAQAATDVAAGATAGVLPVTAHLDAASVSAHPFVRFRLTEGPGTRGFWVHSAVTASSSTVSSTVESWGLEGAATLALQGCATADPGSCTTSNLASSTLTLTQTKPVSFTWDFPATPSLLLPSQTGDLTGHVGGGVVGWSIGQYGFATRGTLPDGVRGDVVASASPVRSEVEDSAGFTDLTWRATRCSAQQQTLFCEDAVVGTGPTRTVVVEPPSTFVLSSPGMLSDPGSPAGHQPVRLRLFSNTGNDSPAGSPLLVGGVHQHLTWSLLDASGAEVVEPRTFYDGTPATDLQNPPVTFDLNPSRAAGRVLPDGTYTLVVENTADNAAASVSSSARQTLKLAAAPPPQSIDTSSYDGALPDVSINPPLMSRWSPGRFWVEDAQGRVVHEQTIEAVRFLEASGLFYTSFPFEPWDGEGTDGRRVPSGTYYPKVSLVDTWNRTLVSDLAPVRVGAPRLVTRTYRVRVPVPGRASNAGTGRCGDVLIPGTRAGTLALVSWARCTTTPGDYARVADSLAPTLAADERFSRTVDYRLRFYGGATTGRPRSAASAFYTYDGSTIRSSQTVLGRSYGWHSLPLRTANPVTDGSRAEVPWLVLTSGGSAYDLKFAEVAVRYRVQVG